MRWIQSTRLCIYTSLCEAKNDPSYPVWSVVNTHFLFKRPSCWSTAVTCFWNNFLSTLSLPVQRLTDKKPSFDFLKFFLLIVVLLKINNQYSNGWNKILFEDHFGDGISSILVDISLAYGRGGPVCVFSFFLSEIALQRQLHKYLASLHSI